MRLTCELEVVYALAVAKGGAPSRSSRARASICLGKKPAPGSSGEGQATKKDELYLIVSTAKNVAGNKYKVRPIHYSNGDTFLHYSSRIGLFSSKIKISRNLFRETTDVQCIIHQVHCVIESHACTYI